MSVSFGVQCSIAPARGEELEQIVSRVRWIFDDLSCPFFHSGGVQFLYGGQIGTGYFLCSPDCLLQSVYCNVMYTVLYCNVMYTVLYCTVMYTVFTILCCTISLLSTKNRNDTTDQYHWSAQPDVPSAARGASVACLSVCKTPFLLAPAEG